MYNNSRKKVRGQRRRLNKLLINVNRFDIEFPCKYHYDHFHVPCASDLLDSNKTGNFVKRTFCQAWIDKTQLLIHQKPRDAEFCRIVCFLDVKNLWNSQIIIFHDKSYYEGFWSRSDEYQKWVPIKNRSITDEKLLKTDMVECGFKETIVDEDFIYETELWFFGELW